MKTVIQRVNHASVQIDGKSESSIRQGLLILVGIGKNDTETQATWMAEKVLNLRIFEDDAGKMGRSVLDIRGELLVVSQFTLYGDCRKGRRPDFGESAPPEKAQTLYETFVQTLTQSGLPVKTGRFQARMQVSLENDGPVTIILDSP